MEQRCLVALLSPVHVACLCAAVNRRTRPTTNTVVLSCLARESGGPCQSVDSLCNYAAASLTCMADGLIRKLPQMMNSINIQQEQELQECKAVLSSEKINHSATRQVGGVCCVAHVRLA